MKVLVTGGAGFIGSHLCERLIKDSRVKKVICVDSLDPTYPVKYKKENLSLLLPSKKFRFYKKDIRNQKDMDAIFKKEKPDFVVHLAAKTDTRSSVAEAREHEAVNVHGTLNILEASKDHGVKKVVYFSSSSVYGNASKPPFKEEDMKNLPLAPYGATKIAGEVLGYTYAFNFGLPVVCFRIFNAYGPRLRPSLVLYKWTERILKDEEIEMSGAGTRKRDFTYVGDIVDAVMKAFEANILYDVFNIGNSHPESLKDLLKIVEKVTGKKAKVKSRPSSKASVELTYANVSKAKRKLGWQPTTSMESGVSDFVTWFRRSRLK